MKKIIGLVSYLLIPSAIYCSPSMTSPYQQIGEESRSSLFKQWRLGLGLALEYINSDAKTKVRPLPGTGNLNNFETDQSQTVKHFQVSPYIEMGKLISKDYYLGFLLSWRHSGAKSRSRSPIRESFFFEHELTIRHYTDILLKVGYNLNPCTMVYGLVGPSLTKWTHTSRQITGNTTLNKFLINKNDVGISAGIGFEYLFKKNYALSVDFIHHLHRPASKNQFISYNVPLAPLGAPGFLPGNYEGIVNKKIDLSFSTIAVRFTTFFSL